MEAILDCHLKLVNTAGAPLAAELFVRGPPSQLMINNPFRHLTKYWTCLVKSVNIASVKKLLTEVVYWTEL